MTLSCSHGLWPIARSADYPHASSVAATTMSVGRARRLGRMKTTYAVKWREPDGRIYVGSLALEPRKMRLEGRGLDGPLVDRQIGYEEVRGVRLGSHGSDRLDGRPALVVERADGRY